VLEGVLRALEAVADAAAALPRNVVRKPQVSRSLLVTVSLFSRALAYVYIHKYIHTYIL